MPLAWVKMHIGLLDNDAFRRLSADARLTFLVSVMLAGKQNQAGRLEIRGVGPMTVQEIARYTSIPMRRQVAALDELIRTGEFLTRDMAGTYTVERFSEKVGDVSTDRTKRYRERHKNGKGTSHERSGDALEEEVEVDNTPRTIVLGAAWLEFWTKIPEDRALPMDPEDWLAGLGLVFNGMQDKELRHLTVVERVVLARIHAAILGNSRVDEAKNRAKAASLAAPIARLSTSRLGEITCRQYVKFGLKTLEIRGGKPFWNPFDIEAAIEYEPQ